MKLLYKISRFFLIPFLLFSGDLQASGTVPYPIWGQSTALYNILYLSADTKEYRNSSDYERNRQVSLDGEIKIGNYFSFSGGYGYTDRYATQSTSWAGWERWRTGVKGFYRFGILSIGAGVNVLGPSVSEPWMGERNPDLLLVRPQFGFVLDFGKTKFQAYALYERETDSKFRDPIQDKFYRYMEAGGTLSYETEIGIILLLETTYRAAVEGTIAERSDSFNLHPGVQIPVGENGRMVLGGLLRLYRHEDNTYDRGFRIGYQHLFTFDD